MGSFGSPLYMKGCFNMYGWCHDSLKENFEWMYLQAFVIDSIITETEDFLEEKHIKNDYDPRMSNMWKFTFHIGQNSYNWSMDMWNNKSLNNTGVQISIDQIGMLDPNKPHSQPIMRYHFGFPHLKETPSPELYVDDDIFREYKEIIDKIIKKKDEIDQLMKVRTNEGMPTTTYIVDDFIHRFNMELSWMKSKKYVSEKMSMDELIRLEDEDLNYNKKIYRFSNRNPSILARFHNRVKDHWMLGKSYRLDNVDMNGLFYVENMDLQDISECGYDTLENLIDEGYKVVEIVEVNEDGTSDKTSD
jgi:hypothetical protein